MMGLPLHAVPEPAWAEIWTAVLDRIRLECGQGIFDTWIAPLSLASAVDGHVHLSAPRRLVRDYVAQHHAARIERAFTGIAPEFVSLDITVAPDSRAPALAKPVLSVAGGLRRPDALIHEGVKAPGGALQGLWDRQPDPQQSFASFVTGPANEFACKAAQRFAESGGENEIGLLFIHGGFGLGKTHLLNALALEARGRQARVLFLRAEDFM